LRYIDAVFDSTFLLWFGHDLEHSKKKIAYVDWFMMCGFYFWELSTLAA